MSDQTSSRADSARNIADAAKTTVSDTGRMARVKVDAAVSSLPENHEVRVRTFWDYVKRSLGVAYRTRVTGLAAEGGFWVVFAVPWLLYGIIAALGRLESIFGTSAIKELVQRILEASAEFLTPEAVDGYVKPMVDSILVQGTSKIGFIGFIVALYAGSRLVNTYVDGITIVYGQTGQRGFVHSRILSFVLYAVGLFLIVFVLPVLVLAGPLLEFFSLGDTSAGWVLLALQIVIILALLTSLYHWAVPDRTPWLHDLPGAIVGMLIWFGGSWALGIYFTWLFRAGSVYNAISAPIAVMLWAYVTSLAVFLGASTNTAIRYRRADKDLEDRFDSEDRVELQG